MRLLSQALQAQNNTAVATHATVQQTTSSAANPTPPISPTSLVNAPNAPQSDPAASSSPARTIREVPERTTASPAKISSAIPPQPPSQSASAPPIFEPVPQSAPSANTGDVASRTPAGPTFTRQILDAVLSGKLNAVGAADLKQAQNGDGQGNSVQPNVPHRSARSVSDLSTGASQVAHYVSGQMTVGGLVHPATAGLAAHTIPTIRRASPPRMNGVLPNCRDTSTASAALGSSQVVLTSQAGVNLGNYPQLQVLYPLSQQHVSGHTQQLQQRPPAHRAATGPPGPPLHTIAPPQPSSIPSLLFHNGRPTKDLEAFVTRHDPQVWNSPSAPPAVAHVSLAICETLHQMRADLQLQQQRRAQGPPFSDISRMSLEISSVISWLNEKKILVQTKAQPVHLQAHRPLVMSTLRSPPRTQGPPGTQSAPVPPPSTVDLQNVTAVPGAFDFSRAEQAWCAALDRVSGDMQRAW